MSSGSSEPPVAILYSAKGSLWASAPRLLLHEKGYAPNEYSIKEVDLLQGENFSPAYLKINTNGTVPTLVCPIIGTTGQDVTTQFRSLNNSAEICEFLDAARTALSTSADAPPAPALMAATIDTKQQQDALIALVHSEKADANAALILPVDEQELEKKSKSFLAQFVGNRQSALEKYSQSSEAQSNQNLANFYKAKLEQNGLLDKLYKGQLNEQAKHGIFAKTAALWKSIAMVLESLEAQLGNSAADYALGDALSLADIHLAVWIARVAFAAGATEYADVNATIDTLQSKLGRPVGPLTRKYFGNLTSRASFKQVYADGLH